MCRHSCLFWPAVDPELFAFDQHIASVSRIIVGAPAFVFKSGPAIRAFLVCHLFSIIQFQSGNLVGQLVDKG